MGEYNMSYFIIKELQKAYNSQINVKNFLFNMIKEEYGYGFIPEYHQDIKNMESYYLDPERNTFFLAIHQKTGRIMGTIGIRAYDRDFTPLKNVYNSKKLRPAYGESLWIKNGAEMELHPP